MSDWLDAEQHVERAHQAYDAGRWDEAESELREAIALDPSRADWRFNLGLTLEAAGKLEDALRAFHEAHEIDPDDPHILLALGVACLRLDKPADADRWLERASRLAPSDPDAYIHRIESCTLLGDHEQAETMFYLAQQCDDADNALALANLADSLAERALHEKAIWCLRQAAGIDPHLPHVHSRLARAYAATGRAERAVQMFLRELRERPGCIDTLLDLGDLLADLGRPPEAGEKYRRVLELESDNADAHAALGRLALRQGLERDALDHFHTALRIEPDFPGLRRDAAALLLQQNDTGEARRLLRAELRALRESVADAADRAPSDDRDAAFTFDERIALADLLLDAGLLHESAEVARALADERPSDARALHRFALASLRLGNLAAGVRASRWALRAGAGLTPAIALSAIYNLTLAHLEQRRLPRAAALLRRGLRLDPEDSGLRRLRSILRLRRLGATVRRAVRLR